MGSGRVEGTGEFLGKINLNKLKNRNPERKKSLQIEEEYLVSRFSCYKVSCRTHSHGCKLKEILFNTISMSHCLLPK